ncbi:hypothetical protein [Thalassovita aquimarina]|uniref:Uncharacterized protein n=1 Tax=Thalassovita aquimarina TaxID=2785917 RepID=A0ABS5HTU5_9RHOB|nr:hypothetical protein [Thalassovita aquimarina]MBR9652351.1 hypothetical protein [Thalassovita aquimarina]
MKLIIATAAFALTAASAAFAGQDYTAETVMTRSVPAAFHEADRDRGLYSGDTLSVTVGQKDTLAASGYLFTRDEGQYRGETVPVHVFGSLANLENGSLR